jgi:helix-turn-helix protein
MDDAHEVLTAQEVASFLRTDLRTVEALLADGNLEGFKIAGEWRVLSTTLADYVGREMSAAREDAYTRVLLDPRSWDDLVRRDPQTREYLEGRQFAEGTMGAWIKAALQAGDAERTSDNVIRLEHGHKETRKSGDTA